MPLARYFFLIGSVLLALLLIADRYLPNSGSQNFMQEARADKSIIRIHSAHQWPEPIVFDTSLPTIVPPQPLPVLADVPRANPSREALAQVNKPEPQVLIHSDAAKPKRRVASHTHPTRVAAYRATPQTLPAGW